MPIFIADLLYQRPADPANIVRTHVIGRARMPQAGLWYICNDDITTHKSPRIEDRFHDGIPVRQEKSTLRI
jgi:hypothetical protein